MSGATVTIEMLCLRFRGLAREDVQRWIVNAWVRPDTEAGQYVFRDIDVERVRLILELRDELQVNEDTLPLVLSLLDQLYDMRRRVRRLCSAIEQTVSDDMRRTLLERLED